jgi:hypothetical protein
MSLDAQKGWTLNMFAERNWKYSEYINATSAVHITV